MRQLIVSSLVLFAACAAPLPESDPVFTGSSANEVTSEKIAAWNTAASWGNHATAGYLTQTAFAATPAGTIAAAQLASWDTAYGWGNHAMAGYVTQSELAQSPIGSVSAAQISAWNDAATGVAALQASPAAAISMTDVATWNAAAAAVQSFPPISSGDVSAWNAAAATASALANAPAQGISPSDIANWNGAYGWGNHASAGYQTTSAFNASPAGGITGTQVTNWNTAYGWGNHASAGYHTTAAFNASPAGGITNGLISNWNAAYARTESDPKVGTLTTDALPRWNGGTLADSVIVQKNGNIGVGTTSPQAPLSVGSGIHLGKGIATNTSKSCGTGGFEWTNTPPSGGACNTYCTGQGFAAGIVSAQGSKSCAGAQCSYISDFNTCTLSYHFNTGCDSCASSFVCTCLTPGAVFDTEVKLNAYLTVASTTGSPPAVDCDSASERGRMKLDPATNTLWVCASSGWVAK